MKVLQIFLLVFAAIFGFIGCEKPSNESFSGDYTFEEIDLLNQKLKLPDDVYSYSFASENIDATADHKGTMGRVLFYDKNLSADGKVSCASCHHQELAFSDDKDFSEGVNGNLTDRNSIALGAFKSFGRQYDKTEDDIDVPGLFWDERAGTIKEQLRQTINNPNEMGMHVEDIVYMASNRDYYRLLNKKAFGTENIDEESILDALEAFINSISSESTRFETEIFGELNFITGDQVTGTTKHELGLNLFLKNCQSCHSGNINVPKLNTTTERLFVANNGLTLTSDLGMYNHTALNEDIGKFKIPGLLNIELTSPYMHDGRFKTLEEVVDHYNEGITNQANLHPLLKDGSQPKKMNMNQEEKEALVAFLKALTDEDLTQNDKWSDPFRY